MESNNKIFCLMVNYMYTQIQQLNMYKTFNLFSLIEEHTILSDKRLTRDLVPFCLTSD